MRAYCSLGWKKLRDGVTTYYEELVIDLSFFTIPSEYFKNKIFMHAIGHCVYHLFETLHNSSNSIMYSPTRLSNEEDYEDFKQQFFDDAIANEPPFEF